MEEETYLLVINGKPEGPFSAEELRQQRIKPTDFVKTPEMDDYKEAHELSQLRAFLGFNQQFTPPQYYAGFDMRLLASIIDWFIISATIAIIDLAFILLFNNQKTTLFILFGSLLIIPVIKFFLQIILEIKQQAGIGKKLLNIKVTNLNGQKPSPQQIWGRNLAKIISTALLFVGYLYVFLNKKQQALHDHVADTLVVKDRLM